MIPETLIITGAGSSIPYEMPSGAKLTTNILEHCPGIAANLYDFKGKQRSVQSQALEDMLKAFRLSGCESIDQFLMLPNNEKFREWGKRCLAYRLLEYQKVAAKKLLPASPQQGDWLRYLFNRICDNCQDADELASKNNVKFMTFNYDVLIEAYQQSILRYRYGDTTKSTVFHVEHIYGALGKDFDVENLIALPIHAYSIDEAANSIRVIAEDERDTASLNLEPLFDNVERVIIVGFGWAPENLRVIPWAKINEGSTLHCGFFKTSGPIQSRALNYIRSRIKGSITLDTHDCDALTMVQEEIDLLPKLK